MISGRTLNRILGKTLSDLGYSRSGKTWRRANSGVINVINLQKSNYDGQHFLNIGFYFDELGSEVRPKEHQCHVQTRAYSVFRDHEPSVAVLLNADEDLIPDEEHERLLAAFVKDRLSPLCRELTGSAELKAAIRTGRLEGWGVMRQAKVLSFGEAEDPE